MEASASTAAGMPLVLQTIPPSLPFLSFPVSLFPSTLNYTIFRKYVTEDATIFKTGGSDWLNVGGLNQEVSRKIPGEIQTLPNRDAPVMRQGVGRRFRSCGRCTQGPWCE